MRTELHIVLCCCSRSAALLFAKSSAVVREEQRGRSRRAARSFANGNTNRQRNQRKNLYSYINSHSTLLAVQANNNNNNAICFMEHVSDNPGQPGCPRQHAQYQHDTLDKDSRTAYFGKPLIISFQSIER